MVSGYKRTGVYSGPEAAKPKPMFVGLCDRLEAVDKKPKRILDVGAATGDLLRYETTDAGERSFRNGIMPLNLELLTLTLNPDNGAEQ